MKLIEELKEIAHELQTETTLSSIESLKIAAEIQRNRILQDSFLVDGDTDNDDTDDDTLDFLFYVL